MTEFTIRRFQNGDMTQTHNIYYRAVREGAVRFYTQKQRQAWAPSAKPEPDAAERLAAMMTYVAEAEGELIGFMSLETDGHLDMAYVLPEWMGKGVATALHAALLHEAQGLALPQLRTEASHLARRFFERQGWQIVKAEIVERHGQRLERFRMVIDVQDPAPSKSS